MAQRRLRRKGKGREARQPRFWSHYSWHQPVWATKRTALLVLGKSALTLLLPAQRPASRSAGISAATSRELLSSSATAQPGRPQLSSLSYFSTPVQNPRKQRCRVPDTTTSSPAIMPPLHLHPGVPEAPGRLINRTPRVPNSLRAEPTCVWRVLSATLGQRGSRAYYQSLLSVHYESIICLRFPKPGTEIFPAGTKSSPERCSFP